MNIYLVETNTRWDEDRKPRQAFKTIEQAQQRMKEIHDQFVEEYPKAHHSLLERRSHVWTDTDIYSDDWNEDNIADIYIREIELQ